MGMFSILDSFSGSLGKVGSKTCPGERCISRCGSLTKSLSTEIAVLS